MPFEPLPSINCFTSKDVFQNTFLPYLTLFELKNLYRNHTDTGFVTAELKRRFNDFSAIFCSASVQHNSNTKALVPSQKAIILDVQAEKKEEPEDNIWKKYHLLYEQHKAQIHKKIIESHNSEFEKQCLELACINGDSVILELLLNKVGDSKFESILKFLTQPETQQTLNVINITVKAKCFYDQDTKKFKVIIVGIDVHLMLKDSEQLPLVIRKSWQENLMLGLFQHELDNKERFALLQAFRSTHKYLMDKNAEAKNEGANEQLRDVTLQFDSQSSLALPALRHAKVNGSPFLETLIMSVNNFSLVPGVFIEEDFFLLNKHQRLDLQHARHLFQLIVKKLKENPECKNMQRLLGTFADLLRKQNTEIASLKKYMIKSIGDPDLKSWKIISALCTFALFLATALIWFIPQWTQPGNQIHRSWNAITISSLVGLALSVISGVFLMTLCCFREPQYARLNDLQEANYQQLMGYIDDPQDEEYLLSDALKSLAGVESETNTLLFNIDNLNVRPMAALLAVSAGNPVFSQPQQALVVEGTQLALRYTT